MEYREFLDFVRIHILEYMPEQYAGRKAEVKEYFKHGGKRLGLVLHQDNEVVPILNLLPYYADMEKSNLKPEVVMAKIAGDYHAAAEHGKMIGMVEFKRENVLSNLFTAAVNYKQYKKELEHIPYLQVNDLAIIPKFRISDNHQATITDEFASYLGIDGDTILALAMKNQKILFPTVFENLATVLMLTRGISGEWEEPFKKVTDSIENPMYVLSNKEFRYGAALMADKALLHEIAEKLQGNLVIFPSSVHELMIQKESALHSLSSLREMVREINRELLNPEDFLSDNVYLYDAKSREVKMYEDKLYKERVQARPDKPKYSGPRI